MSSSVRDKVAATQKAQNKAEEAKRLGVVVEAAPSPVVEEPVRARDEDGHFVADDPSTPEVNEAWEGGEAPKKPAPKKAAPKKAAAKKPAPKKAPAKKTPAPKGKK